MKKKVHVIPHSHWDREWYFTTSRSKVYLMKDLKDVLDTLEKNDEFHYFMLDAQASLLDDYLKWAPYDEERIKKLVEKKKLIIGPWYTQSDQMVISGESIVRNLYYGMKRCEEFGGYMNVAYVPDSFGQAGNMPQIYRAFKMEDTLFWRGVSDDMVSKTDFIWKGDDGSKVFATQIPFGYYIGGNIPEKKEEANIFWQKECFEKAGKGSSTKHIYFPNGFDQAPIRKNLVDIIKQRNKEDSENEYVISCVEDYIADVKKDNPQLEEVNGELLIAKHMRIHKSIFSSRSDLKVENTRIQNYIVNIMEPLLTLSYRLGNEYPKDAIAEIWKLMFENAAHDSIGSCISDSANEDVHLRHKQAGDIATNLVELHSRLIATKIKNEENTPIRFTLFNLMPKTRSEVVVCEAYLPSETFALYDALGNKLAYSILEKEDISTYVLSQTIRLNPSKEIYLPSKVYRAKIAIDTKQLPAMGYTQVVMKWNEDSSVAKEDINVLENAFYNIVVNGNGSLTITNKQNGEIYQNQCILVDNGDDGDSFNYSPPRMDFVVSSKECKANVKMHSYGPLQKAVISYVMKVPFDLTERANKQVSVDMPVRIEVALKQDNPTIEYRVNIDNNALSHRVCVLFDAKIATASNFADQQFGIIQRPNVYVEQMNLYLEGLGNQKQIKEGESIALANWSNDQSSWQEPPISIEPTQSFVALSNASMGMAIFPQGVREYEILNDSGNVISLTLFRTYGFMGKENLVYRPGRASGEKIIETKDAQLQKEMSFTFGQYVFASEFNQAAVSLEARKYNTPIEVYEYADFLNGRLIFAQEDVEQDGALQHTLFDMDNVSALSCFKKCEEEDGYIIRIYNPFFEEEVNEVLRFHFPIQEAYYMNLKEEKEEAIKIEGNAIEVKPLTHCKFTTIFVK